MEWKQGKTHIIPDCLSRTPVTTPKDDDLLAEVDGPFVHNIQLELQDPILKDIAEIGKADNEYQDLKNQVLEGFPLRKENLRNNLKPYWKVKDSLTLDGDLLLKGCQLIIPKAARKNVLDQLHKSHQGIEKTKRRARQTVYWPAMNSDIQNTIEACASCQERRPSLPKEPMISDPQPERPFIDVSMDLFSIGGKYFMVYIDRCSSWPIVCQFGTRCPNSKVIIVCLQKIFTDTGIPIRIRNDGGPQFSSSEFKQFLRKWNISQSFSSPYYPQSNGHAEAAVKVMKALIVKCMNRGILDEETYHAGLLEFRNTPTANGLSPAQILFGHPLRSLVPAHQNAFSPEWQKIPRNEDRGRQQEKTKYWYNKDAKELPLLPPGTSVRIQNPITKKWDQKGTILRRGPYRDYVIKYPCGKEQIRNRRYLKMIPGGRAEGEMF
ncbi:unnamed protein product [Nesidiocoris tenuis]|uniref:RNA-directed DNA polymerase n=1 Tax=Nesidiocoris tenuis TaxID=355587 RepID=A0A6H5G1Z3_9HEMI|nr:unnamed protein product [Nesidiocoris tenuis]